jgi:hypothetical protein
VWRGGVRLGISVPAPFVWRCLSGSAVAPFPHLIEPDRQISCIRLSDKTSRLRPRHVVPKPAQTYEPEVPVEVREWIASAPPDFVLEAQPPAPQLSMGIDLPLVWAVIIGFGLRV